MKKDELDNILPTDPAGFWRIEWEDSERHGVDWLSLEDIITQFDDGAALVLSVGILVHRGESALILGLSYDKTNEAYNGLITIPYSAIREVTAL